MQNPIGENKMKSFEHDVNFYFSQQWGDYSNASTSSFDVGGYRDTQDEDRNEAVFHDGEEENSLVGASAAVTYCSSSSSSSNSSFHSTSTEQLNASSTRRVYSKEFLLSRRCCTNLDNELAMLTNFDFAVWNTPPFTRSVIKKLQNAQMKTKFFSKPPPVSFHRGMCLGSRYPDVRSNTFERAPFPQARPYCQPPRVRPLHFTPHLKKNGNIANGNKTYFEKANVTHILDSPNIETLVAPTHQNSNAYHQCKCNTGANFYPAQNCSNSAEILALTKKHKEALKQMKNQYEIQFKNQKKQLLVHYNKQLLEQEKKLKAEQEQQLLLKERKVRSQFEGTLEVANDVLQIKEKNEQVLMEDKFTTQRDLLQDLTQSLKLNEETERLNSCLKRRNEELENDIKLNRLLLDEEKETLIKEHEEMMKVGLMIHNEDMEKLKQEYREVMTLHEVSLNEEREGATKELMEILIAEFECSICTEMIIDGVIIGCAHAYCKFCINTCIQRSQNEFMGQNMICPLCRSPFSTSQIKKFHNYESIMAKLETKLPQDVLERRRDIIRERQSVHSAAAE